MKPAILILSIAIIILIFCSLDLKKQRDAILLQEQEQEYPVEQLQKTVEALQRDDIQRFIEYVKKVMAGEVLIKDETDPIWSYSYRESYYPATSKIETELNILEINLNGNTGEIKASYRIHYSDASGKVVFHTTVTPNFPSIWTVEKQENEWVIVDIYRHP